MESIELLIFETSKHKFSQSRICVIDCQSLLDGRKSCYLINDMSKTLFSQRIPVSKVLVLDTRLLCLVFVGVTIAVFVLFVPLLVFVHVLFSLKPYRKKDNKARGEGTKW